VAELGIRGLFAGNKKTGANGFSRRACFKLRQGGDRARDRRDWQQARAYYSRYLALMPEDAAIWVQYGHACKELGDLDAAAAAYRRSAEIVPGGDAYVSLGRVLRSQGALAAAGEAFRKALELEAGFDIAAMTGDDRAAAARGPETEAEPNGHEAPPAAGPTIHSSAGTIKSIDGKYYVCTLKGEAGCALFGPYWELDPGYYSVTYKLSIPRDDRPSYADHAICCYLDIAADYGNRILLRKPVPASSLKSDDAAIALEFMIDEPLTLEFRVHATGAAPLLIEADRPVTRKHRYKFSPILQSDSVEDVFFSAHFGRFLHLFNRGIKILPSPYGTMIEISQIKIYIKNIEDFQLIDEVFFRNIYNFVPQRDVCVLDIGMNVGFASLYFATMDYVKTVYSFEPFRAPFERALENFDLNPGLRAKIKPCPYGLGDGTRSLSVRYDASQTIGTSIRGHRAGEETPILIRDIAEVMTEVIPEARSKNLDLVVKMDCEGSEFAICERLDEAGLLNQIRVFMIEWHKWWSEKTQHDIISRLIRCGFDALDHTNPENPHAGMLYAIRTG